MAWSLLPLRIAGLACGLFAGMAVCIQDAAAAGMSIRSGHAGHWYAADRSGEGWVLELRDGGGAWLYWFTYDEQGRQRWLTAAGQIVADGDDGQRIDFPQLVVTRGARFGAAFDPADVIREAVGSASLGGVPGRGVAEQLLALDLSGVWGRKSGHRGDLGMLGLPTQPTKEHHDDRDEHEPCRAD